MNVPACPPSRIHGDIAARGARIDFSVNVATSTPSWLIDALNSEIANLAAYPDADRLAAAEELIAEYHGVPPDYVMLLAGAAEGFVLLPHLPITHPTIIHPGFSEPDIIFTDAGRPVDRVILPEPFNVLPSISDDADLVVIGNPTNPTGVLWGTDDLLGLDDGRRFVVVDEAFIDVVGEEHSVIPQVPTHPRLIVLRSLTKTWAIAGLRVGYMVADPDIVLGPLRRWRPHWPIGTLQIAAAEAVFTHGVTTLPEHRSQLLADREAMLRQLATVGWLPVSDSRAPFVLVRPGDLSPDQARTRYRKLMARGIALRRCDTFPGLGWNYFRLAVRKKPQVDSLITALKE